MSRRVLPSRATRGTKPAKTIEEENKDNQIYAKMFGNDLDDEEDYEQKKAQQNVRKEITAQNLRKYSYARGYTYCFNLDLFPRLPNHPSYAVDSTNIFASTYSQQNILYRNSPLSSIINRIYFGLPYTENEERKSGESKTKNVCHYYLFENEDKKYHLDRMIMSYRKIYKNLQTILEKGKINQFGILKKDPQLQQILKSDRQISQKLQCLSKKIRILQQRKENSINYWYYEDQLFFYHSLNQKLHCQIDQSKKRSQVSTMHGIIYTNEYYLKTIIEEQQTNTQAFLRTAFTYYNSTKTAISPSLLTQISDHYSQKILSLINTQPKVLFPSQLFYFGSSHLLTTLNSILSNKIQSTNEANYYTAKFAWRKLFKFQLLPKKLQKLKMQQYTALAKRLVEQSKFYYKNIPNNFQYQMKIDDLLNLQQLQQQNNSFVSIMKPGETVQINSKELMIICLYSWICQAFLELLPLADLYGEQFTHFMTCQIFGKYSHGLVEAIGKPIIGTLKSNIEFLCDILSCQSLGTFQDFVLHFQYDTQRNVGILWKRKPEEDGWETQKQQQEENQDEQEIEEVQNSPRKRIKQNQQ